MSLASEIARQIREMKREKPVYKRQPTREELRELGRRIRKNKMANGLW